MDAPKKNSFPKMPTARQESHEKRRAPLANLNINSYTHRRRQLHDHRLRETVDLSGYICLLRHLQPVAHSTSYSQLAHTSPATNRTQPTRNPYTEIPVIKKQSAAKKQAGQLITRYLSQLKALNNLEVSVASRLRRRILLLIDSYPGMGERLLSEVSGVLHRKHELRADPVELTDRLQDESCLENFEKLIERIDEYLRDVRLEELKELGWRITTLQKNFADSCNNSDRGVWCNQHPARTILQLTNKKAEGRIKKYKQREQHLHETAAKAADISRSLRKKQEYFVQLNMIEESLLRSHN